MPQCRATAVLALMLTVLPNSAPEEVEEPLCPDHSTIISPDFSHYAAGCIAHVVCLQEDPNGETRSTYDTVNVAFLCNPSSRIKECIAVPSSQEFLVEASQNVIADGILQNPANAVCLQLFECKINLPYHQYCFNQTIFDSINNNCIGYVNQSDSCIRSGNPYYICGDLKPDRYKAPKIYSVCVQSDLDLFDPLTHPCPEGDGYLYSYRKHSCVPKSVATDSGFANLAQVFLVALGCFFANSL